MSMSLKTEQLAKFVKYSDTFIETGAFEGGTVNMAFDCGFKFVHAIELSDILFGAATNATKHTSAIIYHGDSAIVLPQILSKLTHPAVIWLDAHNMNSDKRTCTKSKSKLWSVNPLRFELKALKDQSIRDHLIMIDDMDFAGKPEFEYFTKDQIIASVMEINPNYKIKYMNGHCNRKDTILIACPPSFSM